MYTYQTTIIIGIIINNLNYFLKKAQTLPCKIRIRVDNNYTYIKTTSKTCPVSIRINLGNIVLFGY